MTASGIATPDDRFLPLAFSLFSNPGAYAVLAGAGVSRGAGLPTAWDIVVDLIQQTAGDEAASIDATTAEGWYEARFGRSPTYSDVVEQLALTPTERQTLLRRYFESTDEDGNATMPGPSVAHRAIARMMQVGTMRMVLTMNFDRLFEQALREIGIEPTIVATEADAEGLPPLRTLQHCIIHLHGDYLNATSMRNTAAELSGYGPSMQALLSRVLSDYGLIVAGWSVQYDHALREAFAAQHNPHFTMGWVAPGELSDAAQTLVASKQALLLPTTADDAFGHLADQIDAMRNRRARHPLSAPVAVSRIKRELTGDGPAIPAHDMLASEFTLLRNLPEFHLDNYSDTSDLAALIERIIEGTRVPTACIAAFAYWGHDRTDQWWLPEIERFARPAQRVSGAVALLEFPLVAGALMFYCAGVAAAAGQRFDLLGRLFTLRGFGTSLQPVPVTTLLSPPWISDGAISAPRHHEEVVEIVSGALGLGDGPVHDALQTFEVLRASSVALASDGHQALVEEYAQRDDELSRATDETRQAAWVERDRVLGRCADSCSRAVYLAHIFTTERTSDDDGMRRWRSPIAERLADDVKRLGDKHPLVIGWSVPADSLWMALKGVSAAAGRAANQLEWRAIPAGTAGVLPDELWLDTGRPPETQGTHLR